MRSTKLSFSIFLSFISVFCMAQEFDVYVSDANRHQVIKYDENGENPTVFITPRSGGLNWPQDIVFLEDQNIVLVSGLNNNSIKKYDAHSGEYLGSWAVGINGPTRMKFGPDSLLYVLQWNGEAKIMRFNLNGELVDEFTSTGVNQSIGLDWDSNGNLYVSSYGGKYVDKFGPSGIFIERFISSNLAGPTNIWFDATGDLLVVDYNGNSIKRFNSNGEYQGIFINGLNIPEGVAFLDEGKILVGDGGTSRIKLFDAEGNFIKDFAQGGGLSVPNAVVIRNASITATSQITRNALTITPTIGSTFHIHADEIKKLKSISIYNSEGQLIDKLSDEHLSHWDATSHADGIYILVGIGIDDSISSQQVLKN